MDKSAKRTSFIGIEKEHPLFKKAREAFQEMYDDLYDDICSPEQLQENLSFVNDLVFVIYGIDILAFTVWMMITQEERERNKNDRHKLQTSRTNTRK